MFTIYSSLDDDNDYESTLMMMTLIQALKCISLEQS